MRRMNVFNFRSLVRVLSVALSFSLICSDSMAQKFSVDVHGGFDHATIKFSGATGGIIHYKTELTGGVGVEAQISKLVSLGLEGNFSQQGVAVIQSDGSSATSIGLDYITVPLLVKLQAAPRLSLYAGPQVGILVSATQQTLNSPNQDVKETLEKTDYYAVFGARYKFASSVFADVRFHQGFEGVSKENALGSLKNQYFSFRIGYNFSL